MKNRWLAFDDEELYMLHRHAVEASVHIMRNEDKDKYVDYQKKLHGKLMNETLMEMKRRADKEKEKNNPDPRRVPDVPDSFMKLNFIDLDVGDFTVLAGEDYAREVYLTQVEPNLQLGRNVFNCVKFPEQVKAVSSHFMVEFAECMNEHNKNQDADGCVYLDKYFGYDDMFDRCALNL